MDAEFDRKEIVMISVQTQRSQIPANDREKKVASVATPDMRVNPDNPYSSFGMLTFDLWRTK
jgi:hypothetical protein